MLAGGCIEHAGKAVGEGWENTHLAVSFADAFLCLS